MPAWVAAVASVSVALVFARPGRAGADRPAIVVSRSEAASECPDARTLAGSILGPNGTPRVDVIDRGSSSTVFTVTFARGSAGFSATIRATGRLRGTRQVEDVADSCSGLLEATAVTLALLCDELAALEPHPPDSSAVAAPFAMRAASVRASGHGMLSVEAEGGVVGGIVRPLAPEFGLAVMWDFSRTWGAELEALVAPPTDISLPPGDVRVTFGMAMAEMCVSPFGRARGLGLCAGPALGVASAAAEGFTGNASATRPWPAVAFGLRSTTRVTRWLGVSLAVEPLIPMIPRAFSVQGLPHATAYDPPHVSFLAQLGLIFPLMK
jgi:hypothetical protein